MRDRFRSPGPILFFVRPLLLSLAALLAIQAHGGHVAPDRDGRTATIELQGRIRNWQLGEGYFVVLAVPDVRNRVQAVFPENFDSAGIAADGSFTLLLQHEPRWLTADPSSLQALCPGMAAPAATSFHYLTITGRPASGALFDDFGLIRPLTGDPDQLVFFTFLAGLDGNPDCRIHDGWNIINIRQTGDGVAEARVLEAADFEWQLVR